MRRLLICIGILPTLGLGQTPYWVYVSEPQDQNCLYPGNAQVAGSPITKTLADDITALALYAGRPVTAIATTFYNYNSTDVAFRPRFRFWQADGAGNGLGTYLADTAFTADAVRMAGYSTQEVSFDTTGSGFAVPASTFWTGVALDNQSNGDGMATVSQLNAMGIMPGVVLRGNSNSTIFRSTAANDLINVNNPAGAYESGNLSLKLGVAGQDFHGTVSLSDLLSPAAHPRTISLQVSSGNVTFATKSLQLSGQAITDAFWFTVPAVLPAGTSNPITVRIGGQPFLYRRVSIQVPTPPNANPESIDIGSIALINGDVDGTGEVDAADIDEVILAFGQLFPGEGNAFADLDLSGEVDASDIDIVIANFGSLDE